MTSPIKPFLNYSLKKCKVGDDNVLSSELNRRVKNVIRMDYVFVVG